jgi:antitoxin (DNA-binding transcriptional repressor) of toxin-antitoxin stability system
MEIKEFPVVSVGDLGRNPSRFLDRVRNGERLIVCRHRVPIATIQPLNGIIKQPFDAMAYTLEGNQVLDLRSMALGLPALWQDLLLTCRVEYNVDKFRSGWLIGNWPDPAISAAYPQMALRGLAKRTRGWVATGLGLALKDELESMRAAGTLDTDAWPKKPPPSLPMRRA